MAYSRFRIREIAADVMRPSHIPVVIAVLAITVAGLFADHQNNLVHQQNLRSAVLAEVSVVRAKLEGNVNASLQLVRGLIAAIASEPDMTQSRFEELASYTFEESSQLRSIAVAPDLIVTMTYPLKGNERVIGLNYRPHEEYDQRGNAEAVRDFVAANAPWLVVVPADDTLFTAIGRPPKVPTMFVYDGAGQLVTTFDRRQRPPASEAELEAALAAIAP